MSLTSYRAAPPRVKPCAPFEKPDWKRNRPTPRRQPNRPKGFLRRQPGHRQRVRGVCINAHLLWKGQKAGFEDFVTAKPRVLAAKSKVFVFDAFSSREPVPT